MAVWEVADPSPTSPGPSNAPNARRQLLHQIMLTILPINSRLAAHPSRSRLMGHASHMHASRASSHRTQAIRKTIYGRELEKDQLDRALKQQPRSILVVLGPRNCGKTAILQSFTEGKRHVVYVDCRAIDSSKPTTFISGLLVQLLPMAPGNLRQKLKELVQAGAASAGLNEVFTTLTEIFAAWEKEFQQKPTETYRPVLVIDEVNALMSWADRHPEELRTLLAFFVRITKQEGQCHVVMATSEFSYQTWLNKEIGPGFWELQVIGDFPESEARQFFFQLLGGVSSSDGSSIDKDDKTWAAVYETARVIDAGDTRASPAAAALTGLLAAELDQVKRLSLGGEGFTAVQYAVAALKLLDSQQAWNTVRLEDMQELLGGYVEGASEANASAAGAVVLERLVQANALSVRPLSYWARDIPVEAYGEGFLVTAPTTMDLYCMRQIRPKLEKVLKTYRKAQQASSPQVPEEAARNDVA